MRQAQRSKIKRSQSVRGFIYTIAALLAGLCPSLAMAHHNMDGSTPTTFEHGLASGIAHPIIGIDHLAFLLLLGALCGSLKTSARPSLAFAGATMLGCLLHVIRVPWPLGEVTLTVSVMAAGPLAWLAARRGLRGVLTLFALCGVLHGYAFGESMVGAGVAAVAGYLIGFVGVELALIGTAMRLTARASDRSWRGRDVSVLAVLAVACVCVGALSLLA